MLFAPTLRDLEVSSAAPVLKVRRLRDEIDTFLREHRNEKLSREAVAELCRISPGYVSQLCRKYADDSFSHLKLRYQLEHAVNLLLHPRLSVDEIAEQSGFSCANYFIRRFSRCFTKISPIRLVDPWSFAIEPALLLRSIAVAKRPGRAGRGEVLAPGIFPGDLRGTAGHKLPSCEKTYGNGGRSLLTFRRNDIGG